MKYISTNALQSLHASSHAQVPPGG